MGVTDFRAPKRVFATLPKPGTLHLKLSSDQQAMLLETHAHCAAPVKGGWGAMGWTRIDLSRLDDTDAANMLELAWRNIALKRMIAALDKEKI